MSPKRVRSPFRVYRDDRDEKKPYCILVYTGSISKVERFAKRKDRDERVRQLRKLR